jgi:hypothetical protein
VHAPPFAQFVLQLMIPMSSQNLQKKRSRFAKPVDKSLEQVEAEIDGYVDDYMAPLETLLPTSEAVVKPVQPNPITNKQRKVSIKDLMDEAREKSLAVPIDSSNNGFKLLKKFGYNEGEGLGKTSTGIVHPVALSKRVNTNVSGLGVLERQERKQQAILAMKTGKKSLAESLEKNFRSDRMQQRISAKRFQDARKAQKVMYELDQAAGVPVHRLTANIYQMYIDRACSETAGRLRPQQRPKSHVEPEEGDVQLAYSHMLSDRMCDKYDDSERTAAIVDALAENSDSDGSGHHRPGIHTTAEHTDESQCDGDVLPRSAQAEEGEPTLEECLAYLRDTYHYCFYCGVRYGDAADLEASCPGLTEDDH